MQPSKSDVPNPGDHIDAKYEVLSVLGKGGMGVVVAARHVDLQEVIALKFLLPEALEQPDAVERFLREARAVRKLSSQHVVKVLDIGRLSSTGLPYMAMELLSGEDLSAVIQRVGALPYRVACDLILQAADALGEAHANGIIHRDIKPANLFALSAPVRGRTFIKVLDFGIAKVLDAAPATGTLTVMGSAYYMSPEQLRSAKNVDPRADIWSLGVTLYELITGRHPFEGDSLPAVLMSISCDEPVSPRVHCPDLPPGLETALLRCLVKDPSARLQSVAELVEALTPFAGDRPSDDFVLEIKGSPTPVLPATSASAGGSTPDATKASSAPMNLETGATLAQFSSSNPGMKQPSRRRPVVMWGAAGVAAAALVAGAAGLVSGTSRTAPPPAAAGGAPRTAQSEAQAPPTPSAAAPADSGQAAPTPAASSPLDGGSQASPAKVLPRGPAPQRPAAPPAKPTGKPPSIGTSID